MQGVVLEIFFFRNGQTNGSTTLLFLQLMYLISVMLSEPNNWIGIIPVELKCHNIPLFWIFHGRN